jgi:hypothetical protein
LPASDADRPELGDLDGEAVEVVTVKLTGGAAFPRRLEEDERVVLVITGTAVPGINVKRIDGRLTRIHTVKVIQLAEPTDQLAEEAASFLQAFADADAGSEPLPFDEGPGQPPSDEEE